ncbi:hypothetical protein MAR_002263 [Mya arenaria]|uniref:Uncharacterized protein n=1 Tax=Mya arenaria TaxID=6604 RepID=A0ABY7FE48_MYAAR|nr:hypothetical protein MAR_002263 [Mya arenaria]
MKQQHWVYVAIAAAGTQTTLSGRPGSGSRRRKRPSSKSADRHRNHNKRSSDDYDSSENDSIYTDDSLDSAGKFNKRNEKATNGFANGSQDIDDDLVFDENSEVAMISNRKKRQQDGQLLGKVRPRADVTEIIDGPDGRRTVGIQTFDPHPRLRSAPAASSSVNHDSSDLEGSYTSCEHGYTMVTSPLSLWNSNDRPGSGSQSDQNSTSSAGVVRNLTDLERSRSMTPTPRSSIRSNISISSSASNLDRGPTEMWSTSETDLRPVASFQDELSYVMETEGMSPGASPLDFSEIQSQQASVYMRSPGRGATLIPRPECSTPNNTGRVVNMSFPESQIQQVEQIDGERPVTFEVTVHENNTDIVYNVEKTEYKTYPLRNQNKPSIIPERILVNMTESSVSRTEDKKKTKHTEEIKFYQPGIESPNDDSLVREQSYRLTSSSEREKEVENGAVKSDQFKELKQEDEETVNYVVPSENKTEETDPPFRKSTSNLQHSGVVAATSYPSADNVMDYSDGPHNDHCDEAVGGLDESDCTSDYGTITSIDGRKGFISFTSDSEDGECVEISPRASHLSKVVDLPDLQCQNLSVHNEISNPSDETANILPVEGESICYVQDVNTYLTAPARTEHSVPPELESQIMTSDNQFYDDGVKGLLCKEENSEPENTERVDSLEDEIETDSSSVSTVKQAQIVDSRENLNFANVSGENFENTPVEEKEVARHEPEVESSVPKLDLDNSIPMTPKKDNRLSVSSSDDVYLSMDQSESNTSSCSSDYKTPQQSPRQAYSYPDSASQHIDDVVIPDFCEDDKLQTTPRQTVDSPILGQAPVHTSSPKQPNDVRTVSVNTESVPSTVQSAPPAVSKVDHIFQNQAFPGQAEDIRREIEKKIERLQRHVRSLSDSAISSDYTDENSTSLSPRGSRVYDPDKRLIQSDASRLLRLDISPTRINGRQDIDAQPSSKSAFKDSGNVFDDDGLIPNDQFVKYQSQALKPNRVLPALNVDNKFPDTVVGALLAVKPYPIQRSASLDSLSVYLNSNPKILRSPKEKPSNVNAPQVDDADGSLSEGERPLSPGEVEMSQGSLENMQNEMIQDITIPTVNVLSETGQGRKRSSSLENLQGEKTREYLRSLSETNIDDFTEDQDTSNCSNDSITFVFIGDYSRSNPASNRDLDNDRGTCSPSEVNISGRGPAYSESSKSRTSVISDVVDDNEPGLMQSVSDYDEPSTHTASEEIEEIIGKSSSDPSHSSRAIGLSDHGQPQSTYSHTSDGLVQNRRHDTEVEDSAPLRHRFGIDESVLPIAERSVSADNLPRQLLMPLRNLQRSRSTGMLAVGVNDDQESESGIFPPKVAYSDEDQTEQLSQRTMSDIDASISNQTSEDDEGSSDEEQSSAIVRSICSKSSSIEEFEEEFVIGYSATRDRFKYSHPSTNSSSSEGEVDPHCIHDQEHIRQVLETVQKFIMPKPSSVERGTSMENINQMPELVSIAIQTSDHDNASQTIGSPSSTVLQPDQIILPALDSPFRAQSMGSLALGVQDPNSLELSEGQRNWCNLGELMMETTQLLRRINEKLPDVDKGNTSITSSEESQASVILKHWQEMSIQTGLSLSDLTTVGLQTDKEQDALMQENEMQEDKPAHSAEGTQVDSYFRIKPLEQSETITSDMLPVGIYGEEEERLLCDTGVQTDDLERVRILESNFDKRFEKSYEGDREEDDEPHVDIPYETLAHVDTKPDLNPNTDNKNKEEIVRPKKVQNVNQVPFTGKFLPQIVADLGLEKPASDQTEQASPKLSPRAANATNDLPGFTLPNMPEIEELRKEHARLMENLKRASDERIARREALKARKHLSVETQDQAADAISASPDGILQEASKTPGKMPNKKNTSVDYTTSSQSYNISPERKFKKTEKKIQGPNKNDPETSLEESSSSLENEAIMSGEDEGHRIGDNIKSDDEEKMQVDLVRSDEDEIN